MTTPKPEEKSTDPATLMYEMRFNELAQEKANEIIKSAMFKQLSEIINLLEKTIKMLEKATKKQLSFSQRLKRLEALAFPEDTKSQTYTQ